MPEVLNPELKSDTLKALGPKPSSLHHQIPKPNISLNISDVSLYYPHSLHLDPTLHHLPNLWKAESGSRASVLAVGGLVAAVTMVPCQDAGFFRVYSSPLHRIWLWVYYNKIPIYPIFYLFKGDYMFLILSLAIIITSMIITISSG